MGVGGESDWGGNRKTGENSNWSGKGEKSKDGRGRRWRGPVLCMCGHS